MQFLLATFGSVDGCLTPGDDVCRDGLYKRFVCTTSPEPHAGVSAGGTGGGAISLDALCGGGPGQAVSGNTSSSLGITQQSDFDFVGVGPPFASLIVHTLFRVFLNERPRSKQEDLLAIQSIGSFAVETKCCSYCGSRMSHLAQRKRTLNSQSAWVCFQGHHFTALSKVLCLQDHVRTLRGKK